MSKEKVLRALTQEESREVLGFVYFEGVRAALGWEKSEFINRFEAYLVEGLCKKGEKELFNFLIELASLTFSLYKWGMLLYNLEESLYDNRILSIRVGQHHCILSDPALFDVAHRLKEGEAGLALLDVEDKRIRFVPPQNEKSYLLLILLYLYKSENTGLFMLGLEEYDERFSGSYLSFDEKHAFEARDYIKYIRSEFMRYKERLEELQRLFYSSFRLES